MINQPIPLSPTERTLGWSYYFISIFAIPSMVALFQLPAVIANALGLGINMICMIFILHRYLWQNLKKALQTPIKTLGYSLAGFLLYQVCLFLLNHLIYSYFPEHRNVNDQNVIGMLKENTQISAFSLCLFAPVSEELFYRVLPFDVLAQRSRAGAWALSVGLFSLAHVLGYVGTASISTLVLCLIQYIPAGLCLIWVYNASETVVSSILMHILVNSFALFAVR